MQGLKMKQEWLPRGRETHLEKQNQKRETSRNNQCVKIDRFKRQMKYVHILSSFRLRCRGVTLYTDVKVNGFNFLIRKADYMIIQSGYDMFTLKEEIG